MSMFLAAPLVAAPILAGPASASATGAGLTGGGIVMAGLFGFAWLFHHVHKLSKNKNSGITDKHDPRRWLVIAVLCGMGMAAGTGGLSSVIQSGVGHVGSMLG